MATSSNLQIVQGVLLGSSAGLLYTAQTSTWVRIDKATFVNTDSASHFLTVYLVPNGGTVGASNVTTQAKSIAPGATFNSPNEFGLYLNPGDAIWAFADAGGVVNAFFGATLINP